MTVPLIQIEDSVDVAELLAAFKVLAEPRRFEIVRRLMRAELCVCEIIDELGIAQSLASHHLGVLRRADLIKSRRAGQWVYYSVNPAKLRVIFRAFATSLDPSTLPAQAAFGASQACGGVPRGSSAEACCARHELRADGSSPNGHAEPKHLISG